MATQMLNILTSVLFMIITSCEPTSKTTKDFAADTMIEKIVEFKQKEKFVKDTFYQGLQSDKLKLSLTKKINLAADDFSKLIEKGTTTDLDFQNTIKKGLDRFSDVYLDLDTEDRERVCEYFEELMDIVGLESSGGYLNKFMYGFDPTEK